MKNLWETWTAAMPSEWCDAVIERASHYPEQGATVGFDDARDDTGYRSSTLRWLDAHGRDHDVLEAVMRLVRQSNRTNFGFELSAPNELQVTEYHATQNGHYDWHHDVFFENPQPYDRKLSVVVQLSDPSDYEGGTFEFFSMPSPTDQFLPKGSVLIFPSFFPHRVLPVTSGVRRSLVTWVEGPKWR